MVGGEDKIGQDKKHHHFPPCIILVNLHQADRKLQATFFRLFNSKYLMPDGEGEGGGRNKLATQPRKKGVEGEGVT